MSECMAPANRGTPTCSGSHSLLVTHVVLLPCLNKEKLLPLG